MENLNDWWSNAKRRAYTYSEKKINGLGDYELFVELFGVKLDERKTRAFLKEDHPNISDRQIKRTIKEANETLTLESYEASIKEDLMLDPYIHLKCLRDDLVYGFTNSEAYAIAIHVLYAVMIELKEKGKTPDAEEIIKLQMKTIEDMHGNWRFYMDSTKRTADKINDITFQYKENKKHEKTHAHLTL